MNNLLKIELKTNAIRVQNLVYITIVYLNIMKKIKWNSVTKKSARKMTGKLMHVVK